MNINKERLYKLFHEKHSLKRYFLRKGLFDFFQWFGISVVANHFYEPIPDLRELRKQSEQDRDELKFPPEALGWTFSEIENRFISELKEYGSEFESKVIPFGYKQNHYFRELDAISLYIFLRSRKILSVVEFGQGFSSRVTVAALEENAKDTGSPYQFTSIDPYSRASSQGETSNFGETRLLKKSTQDFSHNEINELLGDKGFLFTDSSHVYKSGSDVEHQFCEIYPHLPLNSYLHVHDIYMPYKWPIENITEKKWFWNEQDYLFQFLAYNKSFKLEIPVYWLHKASSRLNDTLHDIYPESCREGYSVYFQRVEQADTPIA